MYNRPLHHELFFELLRSVLCKKVPDSSAFRNLDEIIWRQIMDTAEKQALLGVCFPALNCLSYDCKPPKNIYLDWIAKANYVRQDNKKKLKILSELLVLFESKDIHPIVMKGFSSAILYPEPNLRICGDIDLFIPDKYNEAVTFIENSGFKISFTYKHHKFYYNGVLIELHHEIISPPFKNLKQFSVHEVEYSGVRFKVFDETTTGILLLTHAVIHLVGPGLGFRHICDLALLNHKSSFIESERFNVYITDNKLKQIVGLFKNLFDKIKYNDSFNSKEIFLEKDIFTQGDCGKCELILRNNKTFFIVYYRALVRCLKFMMYDKIIPFNILKYRVINICSNFVKVNKVLLIR